ncbi:transcriptional regulator, LuxR family [Magnetococcus marinus MC-1]|uniref:Transcriptional regulator, LuxR family n=1 Tax=Magnetococcus marinus (strain ATCC BAA-1437 / JCM 17883 / MC-1) TaxID=156889 RepID=A0LDZ6_MAGMM|nr:response regulator transcription factor [Magnetococcus marinus]ABK46189.1 transcriptional regulator, LuxR family [Magnetococcus marinus MC-1]
MSKSVMELIVFTQPTIQARLLIAYLEREMGRACTQQAGTAPTAFTVRSSLGSVLWIWDWQQSGDKERIFSLLSNQSGAVPLVLLINLPDDISLELRALQSGIRGVVTFDTPLEQLIRAVEAVERGELWFSRKTLTRGLIERGPQSGTLPKRSHWPNGITSREAEILRLITSGCSNKRIAYELGISLHTVKAHTYNLYRKIDASNRMDAANWAEMNLWNQG